jgi:hypothetical protein
MKMIFPLCEKKYCRIFHQGNKIQNPRSKEYQSFFRVHRSGQG